jgi:hypothetical protein
MDTDSDQHGRGTYYEARIALALARAAGAYNIGKGEAIIIYRPGGVSAGNVVATWAEVKTRIAQANGAIEVRCDNSIASCHVPASSGTTLCNGGVTLSAYDPRLNLADPSFWQTTLTIDDGATLDRVRKIGGGLAVYMDSKTTASLTFGTAGGIIDVLQLELSTLLRTGTATQAGLVVLSGQALDIEMTDTAQLGSFAIAGASVHVDAGGTLTVGAFTSAVLNTDPISGPVGASLTVAFDSSVDFASPFNPPFPSYLGTYTQGQLSELAISFPAFDTTANRPVPPTRRAGAMFFDANLHTPIWFSASSVWIGPSMFGDALGKAPTATFPGTVASVTFLAGSDDTAGQVAIVAGGGGMGPGTVATIHFTAPLQLVPRVQVCAGDAPAAAAEVYTTNPLQASFDVGLAVARGAGGTVTVNYVVVPRTV